MGWNLDTVAHLTELLAALVTILGFFFAILPVVWKANRVITGILDMLKEFPLHRHVNGKVIYPKDYQPSEAESLNPLGFKSAVIAKGETHQ